MLIVSSTLGSSTMTGWKRRSSAASFSMYLRYSSSVVAPTVWSSPRASIGLSMFDASIDPSAAPAPTTVWSSSMKRITWPCESAISFSTAFSRSSNSPRYFAPATSDPMSSATIRLLFSPSGTSPRMMRPASPSTIAVLPTPGCALGLIGGGPQPRRERGLGSAVRRGKFLGQLARPRRDGRRVEPGLPQQLGDDAFALLDEREQHVLGFDLRMIALARG